MSILGFSRWAGATLGQFVPERGVVPNKYNEGDVLMWGGVLILVVVVGGGVVLLIRRKLRDQEVSSSDDAGFSLSDLKALRDQGEITIQEYEQTRARVIAKAKANMKKAEEEKAAREMAESGEVPPEDRMTGEDSSPPEPGPSGTE